MNTCYISPGESEYMNQIQSQILQEIRRFEQGLDAGEVEILLPPGKGDYKKIEKIRRLQRGAIHTNCEIFLQIDGFCKFIFAEGSLILKTGQVLIVPAGMFHAEEVPRSAGKSFYNLVLIPSVQEFAMHTARACYRADIDAGLYMPEVEFGIKLEKNTYFGHINSMLEQLFLERNWQDLRSEIRWLLQLLLHRIVQWTNHFERILQPPFGVTHYSSPGQKVKEAIEIICAANGAAIPSLRKIAAMVECSPNYLSSIFHRETGIRLHTYILNRKLDYAEKMVRFSHVSITEIANASGFGGVSYFARLFQARYGMEPMRYRYTVGQGETWEK